MKANSNLLSKIALAAAIVFSVTLVSSCSKNDDTPEQQKTYAISGNANGSQESPASIGKWFRNNSAVLITPTIINLFTLQPGPG